MNPDEMFSKVDEYVDPVVNQIAPILDLLGLDKDEIRAEAHAMIAETRANVVGRRDPAGGVKLGDDEPVKDDEPLPDAKYPPFDQMLAELKAEADRVWGEGKHGWAKFNPTEHSEVTPLMKVLGYQNTEDFVRDTYKSYVKGTWPGGKPRGI